ncbi:MAG TPA: virulence protein RhuM/Fic/DOC family protein [Candidatus Limnocylindria bacterium]|nr:virulence protein RhuM/Fic/DOC family protein [Candidatus Limnocylindria bacterium]
MEEIKKGEIIIYKDQYGPELQVEMDGETVWLSQSQMAELFAKDVNTIGDHLRRIYGEKELEREKTSLKQANTGNTGIGLGKPTIYYNLDVIISVGYRVRSKRGTQFRIWATQRLKDYLVKGYIVNEHRLKEEHDLKMKELEKTAGLFQNVLESRRAEGYEKDLLKIITDYAHTWALLNKYDKGELAIEGVTKKTPGPLEYEDLHKSISIFKQRLSAKKEAGSLFGQEVGEKFKAVLGNINQTYGGKALYASLEERAAHLLYFLVKDHPFADGNKRIGALVFMVYLVQSGALFSLKTGERKINDSALAALTLLVAESHPSHKEVMVNLIVNLINKK